MSMHTTSASYKTKGKETANDEDILVTVPIRHPLTGFARPRTSLDCKTMDTYHRFGVPRKGDAKNPIIACLSRYG